MSTTSATPPATRRIARSYLTDLVAAIRDADVPVTPVVEQLLGRAVQVRHVLRSDQLVLTFDLADDPAGWSTSRPADGAPALDTAAGLAPQPENRDYPGQPGERVGHGVPGEALPPLPESAYPTDAVPLDEPAGSPTRGDA